jgi:hypothetical protein
MTHGTQRTQVLDDRPYGAPRDDRYDDWQYDRYDERYDADRRDHGRRGPDVDHGDYDDDTVDPAYAQDYDGEIREYYEPLDRRWIWVAGVAGTVLLIAVICTSLIVSGGDSGSVAATVGAPAATTTVAAPSSTSKPTASAAPPVASLPAETVTTVTPTPSATLAPTTATTATPVAPAVPPVAAAPGTITYTITGTRPLLDLVTVIYTDEKGALQTDVNVALPWHKTIVLDPGVTLTSVTGTSVTGQLNCVITDAAGTPIAAQNNNTMITNCTK